jgi:hypothetical protein
MPDRFAKNHEKGAKLLMHEYPLQAGRRRFLGAAGGALTTAWVGGDLLAGSSAEAAALPAPPSETMSHAKKKIPIGVFYPVYEKLSLDEMLDKVSLLGLEAMEIGTGFPALITILSTSL